jgi:hypothetical protein
MLAVLQSYGTFFNSNDFSKINFRYGAISSAASRSILDEDMSTLPQMGTSKTQDISSIQIQEKGIAKLLSKLNINKASGPDTISCRILREAADLLSSIYF